MDLEIKGYEKWVQTSSELLVDAVYKHGLTKIGLRVTCYYYN